ncbi:MAG: ferritin-like domain-containing protein [Janthinobacterium lividum]
MTESQELIEVFDARAQRRTDRRAMFKALAGATVLGAGIAMATSVDAQTVTDADILNFALNLEYLEANFYYYAAFGTPIPAASITGVGTPVPAAAAANSSGTLYNAGARAVSFSDPSVAAYAREIAADEYNHVTFLRTALGASAVAQPALDVGITPTGAFSSAARAAGLIPSAATGTAQTSFFDPYANDANFLYGAFIFEDVGVTAYKGASSLLTNKTYLDAAAGILAAEAYHAAIVRTSLDQLGIATPKIRLDIEAISNARDSLDGTTDDDQGIAQITTNPVGTVSNIAPTDGNGLAYGRTTGQVLNIVYLNAPSKVGATSGGFFPAGVNGNIKTSTANG